MIKASSRRPYQQVRLSKVGYCGEAQEPKYKLTFEHKNWRGKVKTLSIESSQDGKPITDKNIHDFNLMFHIRELLNREWKDNECRLYNWSSLMDQAFFHKYMDRLCPVYTKYISPRKEFFEVFFKPSIFLNFKPIVSNNEIKVEISATRRSFLGKDTKSSVIGVFSPLSLQNMPSLPSEKLKTISREVGYKRLFGEYGVTKYLNDLLKDSKSYMMTDTLKLTENPNEKKRQFNTLEAWRQWSDNETFPIASENPRIFPWTFSLKYPTEPLRFLIMDTQVFLRKTFKNLTSL